MSDSKSLGNFACKPIPQRLLVRGRIMRGNALDGEGCVWNDCCIFEKFSMSIDARRGKLQLRLFEIAIAAGEHDRARGMQREIGFAIQFAGNGQYGGCSICRGIIPIAPLEFHILNAVDRSKLQSRVFFYRSKSRVAGDGQRVGEERAEAIGIASDGRNRREAIGVESTRCEFARQAEIFRKPKISAHRRYLVQLRQWKKNERVVIAQAWTNELKLPNCKPRVGASRGSRISEGNIIERIHCV